MRTCASSAMTTMPRYVPGFRGYLGYPLQLCRVWTWSRLVRTFKSMKDFPRVLGIPQIPRKKDGPWDTKHGLNWNAPPICGWNAEGVRPYGDGPPTRPRALQGRPKRGPGGGLWGSRGAVLLKAPLFFDRSPPRWPQEAPRRPQDAPKMAAVYVYIVYISW